MRGMPGGLEAKIAEGGGNLSVGQRQVGGRGAHPACDSGAGLRMPAGEQLSKGHCAAFLPVTYNLPHSPPANYAPHSLPSAAAAVHGARAAARLAHPGAGRSN